MPVSLAELIFAKRVAKEYYAEWRKHELSAEDIINELTRFSNEHIRAYVTYLFVEDLDSEIATPKIEPR